MNDTFYKETALVAEGGGMRGAYTAGIMDILLDAQLKFGGYAGTSAGATHLCNYLSEQRERNLRLDTIHSADKRYMSWRTFFKTGDFFGVEFCYHTIPEIIDPFDYETFAQNAKESEFYAVSSNLETGKAEYLRIQDIRYSEEMDALRASASLPLISHTVEYQNKKLLDGGICDSIPFEGIAEKFKKLIVILTRPADYVKKPDSTLFLTKLKYRKFPNFIQAAATRHIRYNQSLKTLAQYEQTGKAFVFRPSQSFQISRVEKDKSKLVRLYELGLQDAQNALPQLNDFLNQPIPKK